ncbi:hypothetical protein [Singulisphaera sp. GP187]|uniref:hypothetical protein n=1 Tax=Singulisphaera sp. GP187 TaxID=1882752 RepID=UPI00116119D1|nr:hypothetical protein [Singulisphaera sp. GP187]
MAWSEPKSCWGMAVSYEFHITRADRWPENVHWSESQCEVIGFNEWENLVKADPELAIDYSDRLTIDELERLVDGTPELAECRSEVGFRFSKQQARRLKELAEDLKGDAAPDPEAIESDTAEWVGHPNGEERCFWFEHGSISTKNPDLATLDKMLQIAGSLNACVRGDDGELCRRYGQRFECFEPERGWCPLEEFHRGRPDWGQDILREIAQSPFGTRCVP